MYHAETIDVAVIGGGHAGCEAALAAARLGMRTVLFAISLDSIAMMPCNPSIGGSSKGHLVREVDALGGEMGKVIDKTYIQTKMLNTGKGPAVYSLRAQADKQAYQSEMKHRLENTPNLKIKQAEIVDIRMENGRVSGVVTAAGAVYDCKAAVLCMGTYMKASCLTGEHITESGPNNLMPATKLSARLREMGIDLFRFKTGTPARMNKNSLDLEKMQPQYGDENIVPFSFAHTAEDIAKPQVLCWLTYTNEKTHQIIRDNLDRSPMFGGVIEGTGPRYCPSIEDKVVRFADKERHQLFVEPEGENTEEMYIQGMSSSLPEDVQIAMYRTIPGLEHCEITRFAYAIEYDCIDATQLKLSLEFKDIPGLFSAGQFNGSSGYEEAAVQGFVAGVNAARKLRGESPFILSRAESYIGTLIDDLVTKGTNEPYRMMTSRTEYRLLHRQDNADQRMCPIGYAIGLVSRERYERVQEKYEQVKREVHRLEHTGVAATAELNQLLAAKGEPPAKNSLRLSDLVRRPRLTYEDLAPLDPDRPALSQAVREQVEISLKYEGYIARQQRQVEEMRRLEGKTLPADLDYHQLAGLRLEARQKLDAIRPGNLGQAARISGVSPADITSLIIYLEHRG